MDRAAAVTRIQRVLGFHTGLSTEIIDALQDAQQELEFEPELPWFLLTDVTELSTTKDEEKLATPTGFIREWEDDALFYFDSAAADEDKYTPLNKDDVQFLRGDLPGSGTPKKYALVDSNFFIFPTPDAVYKIRLVYYKEDTVLSSNVENGWLKNMPTLMVGVAGLKVASPARDKDAFAEFQRLEARGRALLVTQNNARFHENRSYIMGGID